MVFLSHTFSAEEHNSNFLVHTKVKYLFSSVAFPLFSWWIFFCMYLFFVDVSIGSSSVNRVRRHSFFLIIVNMLIFLMRLMGNWLLEGKLRKNWVFERFWCIWSSLFFDGRYMVHLTYVKEKALRLNGNNK